ncbi:MAG: S8 family serine peptidase, partial [Candidatus Thermoplasmatota archaeon]|nr:S8 family serine peptidase [Candidatus Thermoplasmatota archaeon]
MTRLNRVWPSLVIVLLFMISGNMPAVEGGDEEVIDLSCISNVKWWRGLPDPYQDGGSIEVGRELVLGGHVLDPIAYEELYSRLPGFGSSGLWIVQFDGPVRAHTLEKLWMVDIISSSAVLVEMDGVDIEDIQGEEGIRAVIPYHPFFKIAPGLVNDIVSVDGEGSIEVVVGLYRMPASKEMDLLLDHDAFFDLNGMLLHMGIAADEILSLASEEWVSHISERDEIGLDNDIASDIMDVKEAGNSLGLNGTGQIVAVCDTGLDTGLNSTMHPDLKGRIIAAYTYGRSGNWSDPDIHVWDASTSSWKYKGGHGTHVTGSVLGDGSASNGTYAGMAPAADLVFQSTMNSAGSLKIPPYFTLYRDAYESGARIQTNSWSSRSSYGNYSWRSWQTDNYLWSHRNLTVLFSAGNKGTLGTYSISTQASSKNVIAVGASESYRPSISSWANNISEITSFSSRGPTWGDNRIKPDVVAPGTYILSTRASTISDFWNHYWGSNATYVGVNSRYAYDGGTSMSTPLVAGTTALIRQYYEDIEKVSDPSAALVKATLINGARPLNGNWSSIPNKYEGWGRVNLSNSLCTNNSNAGVLSFIDNSTGLATGANHTGLFTISGGSNDLVITLVWTDYPGSNTSSTKLVNDLDLTVTAPNMTQYRGNGLVYSQTSQYDRRNNVERILIEAASSGVYTINISGYSVTKGPQPYAVALSGNISGAVGAMNWKVPFINANGSSNSLELG